MHLRTKSRFTLNCVFTPLFAIIHARLMESNAFCCNRENLIFSSLHFCLGFVLLYSSIMHLSIFWNHLFLDCYFNQLIVIFSGCLM